MASFHHRPVRCFRHTDDGVIGRDQPLFAAAALSLGIVVWDVIRGGSLKMLAAGSVLIFSALGCYITLVDGN